MKKTTVNLSQIPAWEIGKWYYLAKEGFQGWHTLKATDGNPYPLVLSGRTATIEGRHSTGDEIRNVLEPWEAAILYPECKATAPERVDWGAPELTLPKCLTKGEFEALEGDTVIFWCGNRFVLDGPKNGLDFWSGSELESAFFLTESEAQTFKELYEADEIEFADGTWRMKQSDSASELREVIQNLEAKNTELLHDCARLQSENADLVAKNIELLADNQSLEYASNILSNDCDSYEKENSDLRGVVDSLTAQNKSLEASLDISLSKFEKTAHELMYAKEIIVNLAIRLQAHEDI